MIRIAVANCDRAARGVAHALKQKRAGVEKRPRVCVCMLLTNYWAGERLGMPLNCPDADVVAPDLGLAHLYCTGARVS